MASPAVAAGASLMSIANAGLERGYALAGATECNAFLVPCMDFHAFNIDDNRPVAMFQSWNRLLCVIQRYSPADHTGLTLVGSAVLMWGGGKRLNLDRLTSAMRTTEGTCQ